MKMSKIRIVTVLLFTFIAIIPIMVRAQIMGPPLEATTIEVGYMYKWFHRDMEPYNPGEMKWEVATLFARYGGLDWLTLSAEGGISEFEHEEFVGLRYRRYTVGGGTTVRLYQHGYWEFAGCLHFNEVFDDDKSSSQFDKRTRSVIGGLQVGRSFDIYSQELYLCAGPMYVKDIGENYPWGTYTPIKNESESNFGFALGGHAVVFRHVAGVLNIVYADYFQARLGFALRIGGER